MQKILYFFLTVTLFSSCVRQQEGDLSLQYREVFEIAAGSRTLIINGYTFRITTNWDNFLLSNNLTNDDIEKVRIRNIRIAPNLSNPVSYRFIEEVKVYISDIDKPNARIQFGEAYPELNERTSDLFLLPGIADLKPYISLPRMRVDCEIRYRELITSTTEHIIEMDFDIFKK